MTAVVSIYFWAWHATLGRVLPDKTGSRPASEKSLRNKDKNMLQGDGIGKTYREKTELDRNIECKGAYSVAEFVFMEEIEWRRYK